MRLLILGGTAEASALARRLAARRFAARRLAGHREIDALLSLAGRTENPAPSPLPTRVGGFGGAAGLAAYLRQEAVAAVVDATHPFAARISANAAEACGLTGIARAVLTRPAWTPGPGDRWQSVPNLDAAAQALGPAPRRVFLTSGRLGLAAFKAAPQHLYLMRSIDAPPEADRPPFCTVILARGPFTEADEEALMRHHGIEVLVSKNSGGSDAKLRVARTLGLPAVMVARPALPGGAPVFTDVDDVLVWIERVGAPLLPAGEKVSTRSGDG